MSQADAPATPKFVYAHVIAIIVHVALSVPLWNGVHEHGEDGPGPAMMLLLVLLPLFGVFALHTAFRFGLSAIHVMKGSDSASFTWPVLVSGLWFLALALEYKNIL